MNLKKRKDYTPKRKDRTISKRTKTIKSSIKSYFLVRFFSLFLFSEMNGSSFQQLLKQNLSWLLS